MRGPVSAAPGRRGRRRRSSRWSGDPTADRSARPATWGQMSAPSSTASSDASISSRHRSGRGVDLDQGERDRASDRRPRAGASSRPPCAGPTMSSPAAPWGASSNTPVPSSPSAAPMPNSSSSAAKVPGTGSPSMATWAMVRDVENPSAPAAIASRDDRLHRRDVLGCGRLVACAALAHHVGAHRTVGDLGADVHGPAACVRVRRGTRGTSPSSHVDALGEGGAGDVLDALHQPDQPVVAVGRGGCEADAAVAHDEGGDAVPRGRGEHLVPGRLAVVVGVDVDPTGRDEQPGRRRPPPDRSRSTRRRRRGHRGDVSVVDGDVADERRCAGPVDDGAVADDQIVHKPPLCVAAECTGLSCASTPAWAQLR